MRVKNTIASDELERLRSLGWSLQRLAIHFGVSWSTIKRRLRAAPKEEDKELKEFARRLSRMAADAPSEYCRKELRRLVHQMRVLNAMDDEKRKAAVLRSIREGARLVEEIADECRLDAQETARILELLALEKKITRQAPGGVRNRGRRLKYQYFPVV